MALTEFYRPLNLAGDHIRNSNKFIVAKIEAMPGFVDKTVEVRGRQHTAKMLVAAYNHVFCKKPLPKSIQKLI